MTLLLNSLATLFVLFLLNMIWFLMKEEIDAGNVLGEDVTQNWVFLWMVVGIGGFIVWRIFA